MVFIFIEKSAYRIIYFPMNVKLCNKLQLYIAWNTPFLYVWVILSLKEKLEWII